MNELSRQNIIAEPPGNAGAPTFIGLTFWGEEYRRYFLDYCLASLMSPNNVPAIRNKRDARFLIATTQDDWDAMQTEPIFIAAREHIGIELVRHDVPGYVGNDTKMMVMSQGHKLLAQRMFEARAHGVIAYPDVIFADGAVKRIEQLAMSGYKVVLCIAVRFANEGLIDELKSGGFVERGKPLIIAAAELARLTLRHLHSEVVRLEFEAEFDDQAACSFFWVVAPGRDVLFQCTNWAPILIDYGSLHSHDDSTFDKWTLDGDYVARNFTNTSDIYVVRDTSELFLSGFTAEAKVSYRTIRILPYRFAPLRRFLKAARAHEYMGAYNVLDPVKREGFRVPIRMRGGTASEAEWRDAEARGAKLVHDVIEPNLALRFCAFGLSWLRKGLKPVLKYRGARLNRQRERRVKDQ